MFKKHSLSGKAATLVLLLTVLVGGGVGTAVAAGAATTFLGASNTAPAFNFLAQNFILTANGGNSVSFTYGGSGTLAAKIDAGTDFQSNGSGNSPAGFALFASADEANVDNTIPYGQSAAVNSGAIPRFTDGQCADVHSSNYTSANGGNADGTACPGIGSTRAQYTTGRLVIFSCKAGGVTLAPAVGAPVCAQPVTGFFSESGKNEAPSTMAEVFTDLLAHSSKAQGGSAANTTGGYLAIANPKNGWNFSDTGCGPATKVAPNAPYGLAGMESLYVAAIGYYSAHPRKAYGKTASDEACKEIDNLTASGSTLDDYTTTSPSSGGANGGGNYSSPTLPIIFGDNVTYTQDTIVAGTSTIALLPKSFVVSPSGDDTDFWAEVPECGVTSIAKASVTNGWRANIKAEESCTDSNYVAGMQDSLKRKISSQNFGVNGKDSPKSLIGKHGFYAPIRQWVVVENDDQGQSAATDLASPDGVAAQSFIKYLLSPTGQAVLSAFGYDPIS